MGDFLSVLGGAIQASVVLDTGSGVVAPTMAASGSTFSTTTAPTMALIPSTDDGFTVQSAGLDLHDPDPHRAEPGARIAPRDRRRPGHVGQVRRQPLHRGHGLRGRRVHGADGWEYQTTYPYIETTLNAARPSPGDRR